MKHAAIAVCVLAASFTTATANAGEAGSPYLGVVYSMGTFDGSNPAAFGVRGGYYFTERLAGEAHVLIASTTSNGTKIDAGFAGFIRGEMPFTETVTGYGLVGYGSSDVSIGAVKTSYASVAYGVGAEFAFSKKMGVNVDWINYANANNRTLTAISGGVKFKF
jgi:hypothetical protein